MDPALCLSVGLLSGLVGLAKSSGSHWFLLLSVKFCKDPGEGMAYAHMDAHILASDHALTGGPSAASLPKGGTWMKEEWRTMAWNSKRDRKNGLLCATPLAPAAVSQINPMSRGKG